MVHMPNQTTQNIISSEDHQNSYRPITRSPVVSIIWQVPVHTLVLPWSFILRYIWWNI